MPASKGDLNCGARHGYRLVSCATPRVVATFMVMLIQGCFEEDCPQAPLVLSGSYAVSGAAARLPGGIAIRRLRFEAGAVHVTYEANGKTFEEDWVKSP